MAATVKKKLLFSLLFAAVLMAALIPSYMRVYRVEGCSDAPSFLVGDRIFVFKAAYDLRLPYTGQVLWNRGDPRPGDVILYHPPGEEITVFKRVVAGPGDVIAMMENRLVINGALLQYEKVDPEPYNEVAATNRIGEVVEVESGHGTRRLITYSPGVDSIASFEAFEVPEGRYFVIGDNRDNSLDSRMYGPVSRQSILGRVAE